MDVAMGLHYLHNKQPDPVVHFDIKVRSCKPLAIHHHAFVMQRLSSDIITQPLLLENACVHAIARQLCHNE